jgi:hypothetical protein
VIPPSQNVGKDVGKDVGKSPKLAFRAAGQASTGNLQPATLNLQSATCNLQPVTLVAQGPA